MSVVYEHYRMDISALQVGDKVAYLSHFNRNHYHNAKPATVTRVLKSKVELKIDAPESEIQKEEIFFSTKTNERVGARNSYFNDAKLITLEMLEQAKQRVVAEKTFSTTINAIKEKVDSLHKYRNATIDELTKQELLALINDLATAAE